MAVNAALLRERVTFQRRGLDGNGEVSANADWDAASQVEVWARVRPMKGGEAVLLQRLQGVQPVEITVRASDATRAITSGWRAVWNGEAYNINAVTPAETRDAIAFVAQADGSDA